MKNEKKLEILKQWKVEIQKPLNEKKEELNEANKELEKLINEIEVKQLVIKKMSNAEVLNEVYINTLRSQCNDMNSKVGTLKVEFEAIEGTINKELVQEIEKQINKLKK
jgi:hypothetical protein